MAEAAWPTSLVKRLLDMIGAGVLLIVLAPLFLILAAGVRCSLGAPVFFVQERPGKQGRIFRLVKFRTLSGTEAERDTPEGKQPRTRFAAWMRASGLDELPELWNILKGDMSFVGPRPLLVRYLDRYSPEQARRHEVRPGLTGWAQVHGRNAVDWSTRLELDVWYAVHASPWTDLVILGRTLLLLGRGAGVEEPGEFMGE